MYFLRKSVKQKEKNKILETSQEKETGNKSDIFSFICFFRLRTNYK